MTTNTERLPQTNDQGDDDVTTLKQSCRAYAGSLTRRFKELESCMLSTDNYEAVVNKAGQLDDTFKSYKERFGEYHARLTGQEAESALEEFQSRRRNKEEFDVRLASWMEKAKESVRETTQLDEGGDDDDDNASLQSSATRSSRSSRRSTSTTSSARLRDAKIKAEVAKLKLEQMKRTQELKIAQMKLEQELAAVEVANEMQQAQVEAQLLQEEIEGNCASEVSASIVRSVRNVDVKKELNPNAPVRNANDQSNARVNVDVSPTPVNANVNNSTLPDIFSAVDLAMNMPKSDLTQFDGNPLEYCSFINKFEATIECKPVNDKMKLMYLIQFCAGKARDSIENCTFLGPEGYRKAREILHDQFGQPFLVTTAHMRKVLSREQIRPNDGAALWDLTRAMRRCEMVLSHMGFQADMDSSDNLLRIQQLLPMHMQAEWAKRAHTMMKQRVSPTFSMMADYIEECAQLSSNMFGQNIGKGKTTTPKDGKKFASSVKRTTLTTQGQSPKQASQWRCTCCSQSHSLTSCQRFKQMSRNERLKVIRQARLCDNCFKPGHLARECKQDSNCKVESCKWKHHTLLHFHVLKSSQERPQGQKSSTTTNEGAKSAEECSITGAGNQPKQAEESKGNNYSNSSRTKQYKVCLRIVPVKIQAGTKEIKTWALLDEGSDVSLCDASLIEELDVKGKKRHFELTTVNGVSSKKDGLEVSLTVQNLNGREEIEIPRVWTVDKLPISDALIPNKEDVKRWDHLKGITFPSIDRREVKLLIGGDTPEAFWVLEQRKGKRKEPYAIRSPLGWTLMGPMSTRQGPSSANVHFTCHDDPLQQQLKQFWESDYGGYLTDEKIGDSLEDLRAQKIMEESASIAGGHYEVGLPWRHWPPNLPNNRYLAEARLRYLKKKLEKDDALKERYTKTVEDYITKGYAERVPIQTREAGHQEEKDEKPTSNTWYLPHHAVVHPRKPDKVRVVFDCAAKYQGTSLNNELLQGPDHTNNLVGVLLRFRQEPVAVVGDVEAMFHQVKVPDRDCDALRFLWWEKGELATEPKEYRMKVHLFGATSSPSCAGFALRKTAEDHQSEYDGDAVDTVRKNFYVDDCLKSVKTKEAAIKLIEDLRRLLNEGGFRLTKWMSNERDVLAAVPEADRAASVSSLDIEELPEERTLGILWDVQMDAFGFKVNVKDKPATRRGILSVASSLYDPLGFVAPFVLPAKALIQRLCRRGLSWDEPVSAEEEKEWRNWLEDLPTLTDLKINRCIKPEGFQEVASAQIHHFCDASEIGYASVAYLRLTDATGKVHCSFIMGKSRLAPVKAVSIPRLELMAAVLAVTLDQFIKDELQIKVTDTTYWTDSTSVLQYIRNESRRFKTFVANRVAKIHNASTLSQWRHVDTASNPADDGSRGMKATELINNLRWLEGPTFLWEEEENWPSPPEVLQELPQEDVEVKKANVNAVVSTDSLEELLTRFSSWNKLKRAFAWILRYKAFLRHKGDAGSVRTGHFTAKELEDAELEIIKQVQRKAFPAEMSSEGKKGTPPKSGTLDKLNPINVEGVLRVGGRLGKSPLSDDLKHPLILPHDHHVTTLLVSHYHHDVGHSGAGMTWTALREKYWVIRGGATVRKVLGNCLQCKKRSSQRGQQLMADLPTERVTPDKPPFTYTGVDFFGPFRVKRGRSEMKRYGCVFTCLASRAVHLEVAHSLDTDSFVFALRRFISRRGYPAKIFSDNGTNFRSGHKELKESLASLNSSKIGRFLSQKGIAWQFTPPGASHMGGVWERVIRSVRKILEGLLNQQLITDEALMTFMTEVEAILNARPLTQLSTDPHDDEPLTPNHLLLLRKSPSLPPGIFTKDDCYTRRRWRQVQYLADQFWKRWVKEYLPLLQQRQKWTKSKRNFMQDDLVLVADDCAPRGQWPLGRIVATYPDKLGRVRQVDVRLGLKSFRRPISKLCLLEARGDS
ncbi:uncharacterized protein [Diadema setosum]|uniref:uncharacterized protein n=1 Tax=Diadema setosum TaxID=31175 RepID=UPI003B3B96EC